MTINIHINIKFAQSKTRMRFRGRSAGRTVGTAAPVDRTVGRAVGRAITSLPSLCFFFCSSVFSFFFSAFLFSFPLFLSSSSVVLLPSPSPLSHLPPLPSLPTLSPLSRSLPLPRLVVILRLLSPPLFYPLGPHHHHDAIFTIKNLNLNPQFFIFESFLYNRSPQNSILRRQRP